MSDYYAVEGPEGIKSLHLGPVQVEWRTFEGRVTVVVKTNDNKRVDVYSSATGRSLRVFKNGREMK